MKSPVNLPLNAHGYGGNQVDIYGQAMSRWAKRKMSKTK